MYIGFSSLTIIISNSLIPLDDQKKKNIKNINKDDEDTLHTYTLTE